MPEISIDRSNRAQTALVYLIILAALALLGGVLLYWTRLWFIPHPQPNFESGTRADVEAAEDVSGVSDLFGIAQREQSSIAVPAGPEVRLFGVVAASAHGRGYAILQVDGRETLAVREGENIAPGLQLAEVHAEHIVLERDGMRETLVLQRQNPPADPARPVETDLPVELHAPVITE
ncbi:type II secretion system protein N [Nitrosospira multiformis]|uniref:type II secretion system protein N n=1 Tax=Nitrosospira multiformis TaxID=1231 RepID=UPI00089A0E0A|nr:type II secretion system protein N [Nitrosospira multiformis]SDZ96627.1 general secretion pathway protein C [Nitrosospira multiformis]